MAPRADARPGRRVRPRLRRPGERLRGGAEVRRPPRDPLHPSQPGWSAAPADPARLSHPGPLPRSGRRAGQLPEGLVLDGELVAWGTEAGRLSFEALQRRAAARSRTATALAAKTPAFFIAFDALQIDGIELLALPYAERRRLEVLFAARALTAPWTLCPMTTDPDRAREWLEDWTDVSGVEGILVKNQDPPMGHHRSGHRRDHRDPRTPPAPRPGPPRSDPPPAPRWPHRPPAPPRGPRARRAPHPGGPRSSVDRCEVLLGLVHPRRPRHHPRPAGPRRGDQRRHLRRPPRRLPAPDPVRAPAPGRDCW
ncbi:hypothetical protein [Streptomyces sp. NPDC058612]|uniref:ATP-dependent DNA ligase n=1 Tax=Streptomyces sp. NPDC058612 TaxID=3346555 RepID=UPI00365F39F7